MSSVSKMVCVQWRFFHEEHYMNIMLWCYELDWTYSEWGLKVYRLLSYQGMDVLVRRIVKILASKITVDQTQNLNSTELWLKIQFVPCRKLNSVMTLACQVVLFVTIITIHIKCTVWVSAELWILNLLAHVGTMCSVKLNTPRKHSVKDMYKRNSVTNTEYISTVSLHSLCMCVCLCVCYSSGWRYSQTLSHQTAWRRWIFHRPSHHVPNVAGVGWTLQQGCRWSLRESSQTMCPGELQRLCLMWFDVAGKAGSYKWPLLVSVLGCFTGRTLFSLHSHDSR
jgi:hypothetical protein